MLSLCRSLTARGTAVVFATHDLGNAARFASQTVLLSEGRVVATGTPAAVLTPLRLKEVFGVDTQILMTADGRPAFVFSTPEGVSELSPARALAPGAHR